MSLNMSSRDPFPSPKLENDFTLSGFRPQRRTFNKPTHIAQTEEPWSRLHQTATLSSSRRSVMHYEPQAPEDSLDLHLKSVYDHHKDFLWLRNQVLYQQETASVDELQGTCTGSRTCWKRKKRKTSGCGSLYRGAPLTA